MRMRMVRMRVLFSRSHIKNDYMLPEEGHLMNK